MSKMQIYSILEKYGERGIAALSAATPINTGNTASSWSYEISKTGAGYSIYWNNSNLNSGVNIALIFQLGHGTGYVQGVDYINPALQPVFEELANEAWQEVTRV